MTNIVCRKILYVGFFDMSRKKITTVHIFQCFTAVIFGESSISMLYYSMLFQLTNRGASRVIAQEHPVAHQHSADQLHSPDRIVDGINARKHLSKISVIRPD